jgi:creatinine amidohydrolase
MDMTWTDLAEADTRRWIAVLPVAAVEQHGPHLPLGVDSYIAKAYLSRVHELVPADLPVSFLPVQNIGQSDEHIDYPGTLSLSAETVIRAYTEIGDLRVRHRMLVVTAAWHRFGYPQGTFDCAEQRHGIHAGDVETSLMLAGRGDTVRMDSAANAVAATVGMAQDFKWLSAIRPVGFGWMTQDLHGSGALGDATFATAAKGEAALRHGARGFVELLGDVDRFDLARLADGPLDGASDDWPLQAGN